MILLLLVGVSSYLYYEFSKSEEVSLEPKVVKKEKKEETKEKTEEEKIYVDIKGAINSPGIYSTTSSSRVIDIIELAGGLRENADTTMINLSKKVTDEMVIIIYTKEEVQNFIETREQEKYLQEKCLNSSSNLQNGACIEETVTEDSTKININTATKEELMTLSGIGESKAKDIIAYREKNGNFKTIDEIKNVSGIGENVFAQIKENITV